MSPLAPEAPTGPYRIKKRRERITESHVETFCGRAAAAEGRGDEGKVRWVLVEGNRERYKDGLCSVHRF